MRWLITGARGQLGSDLKVELAADSSAVVLAVDRRDGDLTDAARVESVVADFGPDVVINAAAYTAVDDAESDEDAAYLVNGAGPARLALAVARHGGRLVHVSTDYVFAGDKSAPYEVDDPPAPRSAYGRTKLAGEVAVREILPQSGYVVRTAWVYGASGSNFVKTMARLEGERETVAVVDDQRGSPTWSADLARGVVELARVQPAAGVYHCTSVGETTWYHFAQAVFTELGADPDRVQPTTTEAFPRPAARPSYSVLSNAAWITAGLTPLPHWRAALTTAFSVAGDQLRG